MASAAAGGGGPGRPGDGFPVDDRVDAHPIVFDAALVTHAPGRERDLLAVQASIFDRVVSQGSRKELEFLRQRQLTFGREPDATDASGYDPEHRLAPAFTRFV